jgi:inorganic pyrophosphatase
MEVITAIIETPRGKGQKFDFEPASGYFKLKKIMPAGMVFPFDFGYIPGTIGEDGDPVDVLVISELETFTGCAVDCRLIGAIEASQKEPDGKEMRNDRLIAIPEVSIQFADVRSLNELPDEILSQIESFFCNYNRQAGKEFKVLNRATAAEAVALVKQAVERNTPTMLIHFPLPLYKQDGKKFPSNYYTTLHQKLVKKFGGLTVYSRSPAEGFWQADDKKVIKEDMLVHEVMASEVDELFWQKLKSSLMKKFEQQDVIITCSRISRI